MSLNVYVKNASKTLLKYKLISDIWIEHFVAIKVFINSKDHSNVLWAFAKFCRPYSWPSRDFRLSHFVFIQLISRQLMTLSIWRYFNQTSKRFHWLAHNFKIWWMAWNVLGIFFLIKIESISVIQLIFFFYNLFYFILQNFVAYNEHNCHQHVYTGYQLYKCHLCRAASQAWTGWIPGK